MNSVKSEEIYFTSFFRKNYPTNLYIRSTEIGYFLTLVRSNLSS
jgi:hypothetical protein